MADEHAASIETRIDRLLARIVAEQDGMLTFWHELVGMAANAVPHLIFLLDNPNQPSRAAAARALGEIGDPRAFEPLLTLLTGRHDSPDDRGAALLALGSLNDVRALPILADALDDTDARVRWGALYGLGLLHDPAIFAPATRALHDHDPDIRRCAVEIIGERFEAEGFRLLVAALDDPNLDVARTAANLLYRNTHWRDMGFSRDEAERIRFRMWQAASAG